MRVFVVAGSPKAQQPNGHRPRSADLVIAADGGANLCTAWGWPVHLVIGDMDSIHEKVARTLRQQGIPFDVYAPEKDETDLELALRQALERGAGEIIIAGALGARIDHTAANLALLALPQLATVKACIVDDGQTVWLVRDCHTVHGEPGDTLSLIPFAGDAHGVSISGVYWPLDNADLLLGPSLGISNRLIARQARISVRQGALLVVHTRAGYGLRC